MQDRYGATTWRFGLYSSVYVSRQKVWQNVQKLAPDVRVQLQLGLACATAVRSYCQPTRCAVN